MEKETLKKFALELIEMGNKILSEIDIDPKESRFLELIKDIKETEPNLWVNSDNKWMIDNRGKDIVWVSYYRIWSVFEVEFKIGYGDSQSFLKDMLSKHLKIEGKTPQRMEW